MISTVHLLLVLGLHGPAAPTAGLALAGEADQLIAVAPSGGEDLELLGEELEDSEDERAEVGVGLAPTLRRAAAATTLARRSSGMALRGGAIAAHAARGPPSA